MLASRRIEKTVSCFFFHSPAIWNVNSQTHLDWEKWQKSSVERVSDGKKRKRRGGKRKRVQYGGCPDASSTKAHWLADAISHSCPLMVTGAILTHSNNAQALAQDVSSHVHIWACTDWFNLSPNQSSQRSVSLAPDSTTWHLTFWHCLSEANKWLKTQITHLDVIL